MQEKGKSKWESSKVGWQELLVWFYTTGGWGRRCKQTDVPPGVNSSWYRHLESREVIYLWGATVGDQLTSTVVVWYWQDFGNSCFMCEDDSLVVPRWRHLSPHLRTPNPLFNPGFPPPLYITNIGDEPRVNPGVWRPEMWALVAIFFSLQKLTTIL
jgi:hypothetical protein